MEPITREVYLAILSMLGVDASRTVSVRLERSYVEVEQYTEPRVIDPDTNKTVTEKRVFPIRENGYISRVRG